MADKHDLALAERRRRRAAASRVRMAARGIDLAAFRKETRRQVETQKPS